MSTCCAGASSPSGGIGPGCSRPSRRAWRWRACPPREEVARIASACADAIASEADLARRGDTRLLVATDHAAPVIPGGTPLEGGLPFALWGPDIAAVRDLPFSEEAAVRGELEVDRGWLLLDYVLGRERAPTGWQVGAG